MQTLTRMDMVVIDNYYHMNTMDDVKLGWSNATVVEKIL